MAITTDEDNSVEPQSAGKTAKWLQYELDVHREIKALDPAAVAIHDHKVVGSISGKTRQLDVWVTGQLGGIPIVLVAECKRYTKKLGIGKVDEFVGKLHDIGVGYGVLYAYSGVTKDAQARADGSLLPKIVIKNLLPSAAPSAPWSATVRDYFQLGDCQNENCITGDVRWEEWPQESGEVVVAGSCDDCGTWAARCLDCETEFGFGLNEQECYGCGRSYTLQHDRKGADVEDVVAGPKVGSE